MDSQQLINAILGATSATLGWFARELWSAVKELKSDLAMLRESIPKEYIRREDFSDFKRELLTVLERIEHKLDKKQDK
jgi:hypothetical protein